MAEANFNESIHHYEQSTKHHRKVRRECDIDYISKKYVRVRGPSLQFIGEADLPCKINNPDPFEIGSSTTKYSLKKKKRWMIADHLASTITDYQDEVDNVNVSLLKKVVRDSRSVWINNSKIWTAKAYDKEYIGIENGEQVHKCSRKANSYDLIRKPGLPRKAKRRNAPNRIDNNDDFQPATVHILYETSVNDFDRRISNRLDKKPVKQKHKERKMYTKSKRDILPHDFDYEDGSDYENDYEYINDYDETIDCVQKRSRKLLFAINFGSIARSKKDSRKRKKQKEGTADGEWEILLRDGLADLDNQNADAEMITNDDGTSEDCWNAETSDWLSETLPYIEKRLFPYSSLEDYIFWYCGHAEKVNGLYPTTYACFTGKYSDVVRRKFGSINAHVYLREGKNKENEAVVRWICNKKTLNIAHQLPPLIYRRAPYHPALYSPESSHVQAKAFNQFFELSPITHKRNEEEAQTSSAVIKTASKTVCEICLTDAENMFALECQHFFCETCWIINTREAMRMGKVPITCMHVGCTVTLTTAQMATYMPMAICERYTYLIGQNWIRCDTCNQIIGYSLTSSRETFVVCDTCKSAWCLRCNNRAHHPLPCSFASFYRGFLDYIDRGGDAVQRFSIDAKICPNCKRCYNRIYGCRHITCPCGTQFCDDCGTIFERDESGVVIQFTHTCTKNEDNEEFARRFFMFDVISKYPQMERLYARSLYQYREERRPVAINHARRAIASANLDPDYLHTYIAAVEILELSGVYVTLCKHHLGKLWETKYRANEESDDKETRKQIISCHDRLTFAVKHFQDALLSKSDKMILLHLIKQIEVHLRRMMQIGYSSPK